MSEIEPHIHDAAPAADPAATAAATGVLYCANHPTVETSLRCNRCNKPICSKCAVLTPVGYRCKECVRGQQQIFETVVWYDYLVAGALAAILGGLAGALLVNLGWFTIFLAPVAGGAIAEVVRVAVRRRRGRNLYLVAAGAYVVGCLPLFAVGLIVILSGLLGGGGGGAGLGGLFRLLWPAIYTALAVGTFYTRLRGISV
jgi:hypothetical protein